MHTFNGTFEEIKADFTARKIPLDVPGFYDHPNFLKVERVNPLYLNNYARYVNQRPRDAAYDAYVMQTVPVVAEVFRKKLKANGRLGACVDVSSLLSHALEREGIWNYIVKGSLTIDFPHNTKISRKYFWSVDVGEFTAAHAWVVAPPLYVVDISLQLQPYTEGEEKHLPLMICAEAETLTKGTLEDVVSPQLRAMYGFKRISDATPEVGAFMEVFPARRLQYEETVMKYIPVATGAPDCSFEEQAALTFNGKSGYEVYMTDVKAALAAHKDETGYPIKA